eukprot:6393340-Lingulodinium_polyedra.AAC.1
MGPPSTHPTTAPTLPCLTTTGRVATCSSMSPWLGRFPVATSSGRLWMPALLPLWLSATSLPPTAMWGPTGSSPLSLRSSGPWAPRQRSFSTSAASAVKTASTSRVRPPRGRPARGPRIGGSVCHSPSLAPWLMCYSAAPGPTLSRPMRSRSLPGLHGGPAALLLRVVL